MKKNTIDIVGAKRGDYMQIDFRQIKPLDLAGGNGREEYPEIPQLADSILFTGSVMNPDESIITAIKVFDAVADIKELFDIDRAAWDVEVRKRFKGKILVGGINTPLVGYVKANDSGEKFYHTLGGHRRTLACELNFKLYGVITIVPFFLRNVKNMSEKEIISFMLDENENRVGFDIFEQAKLATRMVALDISIGEIAIRFGKRGQYQFVEKLIKLDSAPTPIKKMVRDNTISPSAVFELMKNTIDEKQLYIELQNLYQEATNRIFEKTKNISAPVKIKTAQVKAALGNIDSSIELKRFFKKYPESPQNILPENESIWMILQALSKNQITFSDLEKRFIQ